MWVKGFWKVCAATAIYGLVHSVLASRQTKQAVQRWAGSRYRNALYRPFYLLQSLGTMFLLTAYIRRQPGRTLYHLRGVVAVPLRLGQIGGVTWATYGAYEVGLLEILGIRPFWQLLRGKSSIAPEPEAQGPALNDKGALRIQGPFRYSRHPLNLAPFIILWLNPRQTTNLLAYNAVSTVYLLLGSLHEESRLRAAYGDVYRQYEKGPVPFYFPKLPKEAIS